MGTKRIRVLQKIRRSSRLQSFAAKMGVERLQLLVRFCNLIGLFPFRMILNEQTNQFHRFDRHWRHPSNWWFTFLCVGFIVFIFPFAYFNYTFIPGEGGKITIFFIG